MSPLLLGKNTSGQETISPFLSETHILFLNKDVEGTPVVFYFFDLFVLALGGGGHKQGAQGVLSGI